MNVTLSFATAVAPAILLVLLTGCSQPDPVMTVRTLSPDEKELRFPETTMERFRMRKVTPEPKAAASGIPFVFTVPEGWQEVEPTSMRQINLTFGENAEGECYLTTLAGAGGGLVSNVNRWRGQMGLPEQSESEIQELPTKTFFGREATFVSLDGDFAGMGGGETKKDYRMLGLILSAPEGAVTLKMTGPRELVAAQTPAFESFIKSLGVRSN